MPGKKNNRSFINYLPIYGCFSTGTIYAAIGVIAILSFLRLKQGGADEGSLLAFLNDSIIGKIFIWAILLGTICYIIWRIYESITDPYNYGKEAKGVALRTGIVLSTISDALIAYSAVVILLGKSDIRESGQPDNERSVVASMLKGNWGDWLIIATGSIILITAIVQLIYGITRGYKERLNIRHFSAAGKRLVHSLAWIGYLARAIIVGIIGFFLVKAGIAENARYVVNTDKAFDFIGDRIGHVYFNLVAIGTICYGIFMFILGARYDADKGLKTP